MEITPIDLVAFQSAVRPILAAAVNQIEGLADCGIAMSVFQAWESAKPTRKNAHPKLVWSVTVVDDEANPPVPEVGGKMTPLARKVIAAVFGIVDRMEG